MADSCCLAVQVTAIMFGVEDLARSKRFYGEGLGCAINQDHRTFVSFNLGDGSSSLALYQWEAAAKDAGVSPEGSGFRGVSFHYIVQSSEELATALSPCALVRKKGFAEERSAPIAEICAKHRTPALSQAVTSATTEPR